ncbi:hypothetical protein V8V93_04460 [Pseudodesulfovibrio methanolicus]|uniref:Uncharacterized protein n=1 Tax=Pseudodesulfovibrio methanolicus TaxID=3126690 RepID=A0ABZ2J2U6_9BACT
MDRPTRPSPAAMVLRAPKDCVIVPASRTASMYPAKLPVPISPMRP